MTKSKATPVPFVNLPAQCRALEKPLLAAMTRVLRNARFILGPETEALEREIAAECGTRFAVGVNSGTDALLLTLRALDIGPGDEVVVPAFTFVATATAVLLAGATPVLADIDPATYNLDPAAAAAAVTRRTKALIPVHLYGQPADMTALNRLAKSRGLAVVEDAAQALGARWRGRPVGSLGTAGCLSFFPTKNLGGLGDGGMIVTNRPRLAERLQRLRQHGAERKYVHTELGYNSRLDDVQAAALRVKLPYLQAWNERRRSLAQMYSRALGNLGLGLPVEHPGAHHVYHQYTIRAPRRDALQAALAADGIGTSVHYPVPLHRQPVLTKRARRPYALPVSDRAAREILCLPVVPEITDRQADHVVAAIRRFYTPPRAAGASAKSRGGGPGTR